MCIVLSVSTSVLECDASGLFSFFWLFWGMICCPRLHLCQSYSIIIAAATNSCVCGNSNILLRKWGLLESPFFILLYSHSRSNILFHPPIPPQTPLNTSSQHISRVIDVPHAPPLNRTEPLHFVLFGNLFSFRSLKFSSSSVRHGHDHEDKRWCLERHGRELVSGPDPGLAWDLQKG